MSGAVALFLAGTPLARFTAGSQVTAQIGSTDIYQTYRDLTAAMVGGNDGWTFAWSKSGGSGLMSLNPTTGDTIQARITYNINSGADSDTADVTLTATQTSSGQVASVTQSVSLAG